MGTHTFRGALWLAAAAAVGVLTILPRIAVSAQSAPPSPAERQGFHEKMLAMPHGEGCFIAHYADSKPRWQKTKCGTPPKTPNPMVRGPKPKYVGAGTDYFARPAGGLIKSATGSFDAVTNVTAESGTTNATPTVAHPNVYSLQMNANVFTTPSCSGSANCYGWEQFIYSQTQCNGACIFIEYWLLNHASPCPAGQGWTYYPGTFNTVRGCFLNAGFTGVRRQSLNDLGAIRLIGQVSGNTDTISLSVANGDVYLATNPSIAGLGQGWTQVEYNLVGDCCALGAYFTSGPATITVRVGTVNGTQNAPVCSTTPTCTGGFCGDTAETNNLNLTGSCSTTGGAQPSISFTESGGGSLPLGISQGDTHLVTIDGDHYDFQGTGEYILVQAGTDLMVQARQDYLGPNRAVSWNVGLGVQMGRDSIILFPNASMLINLASRTLADGESVALDAGVTVARHGSLFTISRPRGDIVQANALGNYIDATVRLAADEAPQAHGLLVSRNGALSLRDGTTLNGELSIATLHDYAESWRVDPAHSLFPAEGRPVISGITTPGALDTLSKEAQDKAREACSRAGVTNAILLKDCILDVGVTGNDASSDTFVYTSSPKRNLPVH
jgi:hypothetical protein